MIAEESTRLMPECCSIWIHEPGVVFVASPQLAILTSSSTWESCDVPKDLVRVFLP